MQNHLKTFTSFVKVSTSKYRERVIRIVEESTDNITARHKFLSRLLNVSIKGIPVIYLFDDGFNINIVSHNDIIHKNNEIEQFMMNTDFIMRVTNITFFESQSNLTKEIMKQYTKIPFVEEINLENSLNSSSLGLQSSQISTIFPVKTNNVQNKNDNYIDYKKGYIPEKNFRSITPINNTLSIPILLNQRQTNNNIQPVTQPSGFRFYSKSASPTLPLNIYAKEFIPIHHK